MSGSEKIGDNFSEAWRKAMSGSEVRPPESVWAGIDRSLANAELARYKKKVKFYKWAAVIALLITAAVSVNSLFNISMTSQQFTEKDNSSDIVNATVKEEKEFLFALDPEDIEKSNRAISSHSTEETSTPGSGAMLSLFSNDDAEEEEQGYQNSYDASDISVSRLSKTDIASVDSEMILASKKAPQRYYIFQKFIPNQKSNNRNTGKLWAGLEVGSGAYNPNYQVDNSNSIASAMLNSRENSFVNPYNSRVSTPNIEESMSAGINYQVGVNVGMRIVDKWTLESGVQYAMAQTTTNTNILIENRFAPESVPLTSEAAATTEIADITEQQEIIEYREEDLPLQNTFQFASFPLKAGYILMDKKFSVRLNAGMIANVYLGNSLRDRSERVATLDIEPGAESPYRDLSFSGITGLTMGYEFMDRFHLTVEPNYTHALSPFTKSSSNIDFSPSGLGVMAGIRYSLK